MARLEDAAVGADRWYELVHSETPALVEVGCEGAARLAVFAGDFSLADPLLDLPHESARNAAFFAADQLHATGALERLRARLLADSPEEPWEWLGVLERLGDTTTRAAFLQEPVPKQSLSDAMAGVPASFIDRSAGGDLREPALLHLAAGETLVPEAAIDAFRRRDGARLAALLSATLPTDVERAKPWLRATAAGRLAIAREALARLTEGRAKKADFDRLAAVALAACVGARARVEADGRAALALAFLEGEDVSRICRDPGGDPAELLNALANAGLPSCDDAVVSAALGWKLPKLAGAVARIAAQNSFLWAYARCSRAAALDAALAPAFLQVGCSPGTLGLQCHLASKDASRLVLAAMDELDLSTSPALPFVVRSFPVPEVLAKARRTHAVDREELQQRLEFLAGFDPTLVPVDETAPVLHCLHCGHLWNAAGIHTLDVLMAHWPDPAVPCPACGVRGEAVAYGDEPAGRLLHPYVTDKTPRGSLARLGEHTPPVWAADIADLAGEKDLADRHLQLASSDEQHVHAQTMIRILRRRGDVRGIQRVALAALSSVEGRFLDDSERDQLEGSLREACDELGVPMPVIPLDLRAADLQPSRTAPEPVRAAPRTGRNDPCPCGSGKKFKKCHGA